MRIDVLTVFPDFFSVLDISLVGKAREAGLISARAHDLRNWTSDVHRTVDDTPIGGGAGMVMKPDIWGKAIDSLLDEARPAAASGKKPVLAIPTPAGIPLTQKRCGELAGADHVIIACGRYEGIDTRVAEHYRQAGLEVFEYSLGDYVLNGGEVAAVALIEAVARLVPGVVGNPESLVEESHGEAGLLEYNSYTRPVSWRGLQVPEVLLSGDHGKVARVRRNEALEKTCARRPDMIAALAAQKLDKKDRAFLAQLGWYTAKDGEHPIRLEARVPGPEDASRLAALAARTFPDACPPEMAAAEYESFVAENLSTERFEEYLAPDGPWLVVTIEADGRPVGYTLSLIPAGGGVAGAEEDAPVGALEKVLDGPLVELSKFYVERAWHSSGAAYLLGCETLRRLSDATRDFPAPFVWLGTNKANRRAMKAYRKFGFRRVATRAFKVGGVMNDDVVFARPLHHSWEDASGDAS